ncbi:FUSC family protein [Pontibacter roseus]|uniref:FUSC family protein n=1 Tax=Pontibacter roseus TaxID=336989 RepID=UPI00036A3183|nr:FUSC family protein [Pontibacter roseus]
MNPTIRQVISAELKSLFELKKTERLWHVPVLASLCVGLPLLAGYAINRLDYGILGCMGGLVILYLPSNATLAHRMLTLIASSFGFMVSYAIGIGFSFNPFVSSLALGLFALGVHWVVNFFAMRPPGSFFFIMIASIASATPFELESIPTRIGLIGIGTMLACVLAFFYSLLLFRKQKPATELLVVKKSASSNLVESVVVGVFMGASLLTGHLLQLSNPYWIPISCLAVMQGVSIRHVWQRSFQRILGTFLGLGLAWLLLPFFPTPLAICIGIIVLQFIIEMLIVRHYGLAVIFITPMTILLAEAGSAMAADPNTLISSRFTDIVLGSLIGAVGGVFLYHQKLRHQAVRQIRKTKVAILRRQPGRSA